MKKLFLSIVLSCAAVVGFSQSDMQADTIRTSSGLKYVAIKPGVGEKPGEGEKVKIYYRGTLTDGLIFDSNMERAPMKYRLGTHEAIPGWEEGLKLMRKGEKGYLFVPSDLAYGNKGVRSPRNPDKYIIPPGSDLIFEVEMVDIEK